MDIYQQFIHKSRYARYLPKLKRREHIEETVDRYLNFIRDHIANNNSYKIPAKTLVKLRSTILNFESLPSMRSLMTAGIALSRDHTAGYNCAYIVIDDPKAFDESMHILMCGTGIGFSVERQYVNKLPEVPDQLFKSDTIITVRDSKEGWAKALRMLIALLYAGEIPNYNIDKLRPAGAPLKTFGGRSSGPGPLVDLFKFVIATFEKAKGRRLTSIECHDIMCKIGDVVVVGGVRRSAMISLSNLSDDRMRQAKSGAWWDAFGYRALANNSAVYTEKPDVGAFMHEWLALYESKSGERGLFSRDASKRVAAKNGRRDTEWEFGTNPCSEIILRPNQFCNLSEVVARENDTIETLLEKVELATILGTLQSTLTHFPYLRKVWQRNTEEERLLGVSLTGIYDCPLLNNYQDKDLPGRLQQLKEKAIETNKEWSKLLGIPQSTAITCVKPSGTVSQLVDAASGIHTRHDPYYIRRVRNDNNDPITKFLIKQKVPNEPDVTKPFNTTIFSFAKKSPEKSKVRNDITSIEHLELWLMYQRYWCEHKPSVTISVKEEDWPAVGAWVWKNFDEMSGISFLPYDGGSYRQAPYETITKEEYEALLAKIPTEVDWNGFEEIEDNVEGTQTLACTAGGCEL